MTGGIAAYKAVEVCRRLVDAGAHVVPVMTRGATRFVGPVTLSASASEPVQTALFDGDEPIPHTRLGQSADLIVVVPATARLIGSYAAGISADLLTATLLATRAPVLICPAMHTEMWEHPAVQENLATLRRRGVQVVAPASGRLAGGDIGQGRLADPADIVAAIAAALEPPQALTALSGVTAMVTAGGTREPIDPVRFIGNRSSGKQGYALAEELVSRGATVTLVTTASLPVPAGVEVVPVDTAAEMEHAVLSRADANDIVVMAAAVADFRPQVAAAAKIKKADGVPVVVLERTVDITAALGTRRRPGQVLVGFAAETPASGTALVDAARSKLVDKGLDMVVANDVSAAGVGFVHDTNAVTILEADGRVTHIPLATKREVASDIVDVIVSRRSSAPGADGTAGPPAAPAQLSPPDRSPLGKFAEERS